jgi:hypothetical protein
VGHTDQQNRKAAYHGTYITLLDELAYDENFLKIQGREAPDSEKETDRWGCCWLNHCSLLAYRFCAALIIAVLLAGIHL